MKIAPWGIRRRLLNMEGGFSTGDGKSAAEVIGCSQEELLAAAHGRRVSQSVLAKLKDYFLPGME